MAVKVSCDGGFTKTEYYLKSLTNRDRQVQRIMMQYGEEGVNALKDATPIDTGLTANSWVYEVNRIAEGYSLEFKNTNIQNGVNIALILQYGHGTNHGAYVPGRDYINPAIRPIFDDLQQKLEREFSN